MVALAKRLSGPLPRAILMAGSAMLFVGCTGARVGVELPSAMIYRDTTAPMTIDRDRRTGAPTEIPETLNVGRSQSYQLDFSVPGIDWTRGFSIGWGDMSLETALREGNLESVTYADGRQLQILRIFTKAQIIAYGPPEGSSSQQ
ncbi:hypothetical protein KQI84_10535 [bacterium]|nr:hypothetical protein [bacterium]